VEAEEAEAGDGVEVSRVVVAVVVVAVVVMVGGPRAEPANGCRWLIAAEDADRRWEVGEGGIWGNGRVVWVGRERIWGVEEAVEGEQYLKGNRDIVEEQIGVWVYGVAGWGVPEPAEGGGRVG
jgi:hypothetical protein